MLYCLIKPFAGGAFEHLQILRDGVLENGVDLHYTQSMTGTTAARLPGYTPTLPQRDSKI